MLTGAILACVLHASSYYNVPVPFVRAVMHVEGGRDGEFHYNTDGSYDIGRMQINSRWLPTLAKYHISAEALSRDGCLNVAVGTWILRLAMDSSPHDFWYGIGAYHSHTLTLNRRYAWAVYRALKHEKPLPRALFWGNESPRLVMN